MCITSSQAKLKSTIVYAGVGLEKDQEVHVLAYQNQAQSEGANAMILPIPAIESLSSENMVDTTGFGPVLTQLAERIRPRYRSLSLGYSLNSASTTLFTKGSYTVLLAENIRKAVEALTKLPEDLRPNLTDSFVDGFENIYPDTQVALCCWKGVLTSEPLLWWYKPKNPDVLFVPTMDAHDGEAPRVGENVHMDHVLLFGSFEPRTGTNVQDIVNRYVPYRWRKLFPTRLRGKVAEGLYSPNEDTYLKVSELEDNKPEATKGHPDAPLSTIRLL
jgi:hypothetical protein